MAWLITMLQRLRTRWERRYEPSRHYMRGPGPATAKRRRPAEGRRSAEPPRNS